MQKLNYSRQAIILGITICCAVSSCENRLKKEYKEKKEKYQTLMYRSHFKQCFVDSSRKYDRLYRAVMGWEEVDINAVDTIPVKEP